MELLYQLPEPEDLDRDECAASLHGLRDEIKKLHDKYGSQAAAALKEVEHIIKKYENNTNEQEQQARAEKHLLAKHKNVDQATIVRAQNIVRAFLKRRRFTNIGSFLSGSSSCPVRRSRAPPPKHRNRQTLPCRKIPAHPQKNSFICNFHALPTGYTCL
eukprot:TRINITY_DN4055_c0_g2_i2.p1 TRINITY_DN4055_c0_g2~~TRINITY_DN4055_c0_g2_i2.p1  ORF type:complete len:159 (-),score=19.03 TRINITY_DN4055_c0_g2_i2:93-569(-)